MDLDVEAARTSLDQLVLYSRLGLGALLIWIASRIYDFAMRRAERAQESNAFLRALYTEVDFNTADMERFLAESADMRVLEDRLHDPDFTPHITDARHTDIYRSKLDMLHVLHDGLIGDIVTFYGDLEKVRTQIDGVRFESYGRISPQGRINVIRGLMQVCRNCEMRGQHILSAMERDYPVLKLKRHRRIERCLVDNSDELAQRMRQLSSDLDRVGSGH